MFEFLQPLWMLAAAGIIVPVLIHLWNVREGKTLKVGSVSLLVQSARQHARSFRIRELLLLLLRCLLILLLSALMAEPVWLQTRKPSEQKGWILLERSVARQTYDAFRRQIDSLAKAGLQMHYFETGFPLANFKTLTSSKDTGRMETASYWTLLRTLQHQIPAGLPVNLYTGNRLNRFSSSRPRLALNLHWHTFTPSDSVRTWLAGAQLTDSGTIKITRAISRPASTSYTDEYIPGPGTGQSGYATRFDNGRLVVSPAENRAATIEVDTAATRIIIYAGGNAGDAAYLQAAIRAIQQYSHRNIQVQVRENISDTPSDCDWLFWLSGKPLPASVTAKNSFLYANGKPEQQRSWLLTENIESSTEPIAVYTSVRDISAGSDRDVVWKDGFGLPLLTRSMQNNRTLYTFYSRFHPQWNDLPWSIRFPGLMMKLLLPAQKEFSDQDKRMIASQQLAPVAVPADQSGNAKDFVERTPLTKILWIAAFLTLLLERILSYKTKKPVIQDGAKG